MIDFPPLDPGIEIVAASRGISKGIAQTEGGQIVPKAFVQMGSVQAGAQWKNVKSPVARGEAAAFVNVTPKLGAFQLTLGASYKFQTGVRPPTDDDSFEFSGVVARKWGKVGARASVVYSPNDLGSTRSSAYFEGGPTLDIDKTTKVSANIGRRQRAGSPDYTSFNVGLSAMLVKGLTLDGRYFDTAQSEFGEAYHGRFVISGRLSF